MGARKWPGWVGLRYPVVVLEALEVPKQYSILEALEEEAPVAATAHLCVFSAEGACSETPLTSEPPLPDAEPLTSEPPLADAAPLTSESAAADLDV